MKILMISTDRKVFENNSAVRHRIIEYGSLADELHVVVFARKSFGISVQKARGNVLLYPTNSVSKLGYIGDAIKISKRIVGDSGNDFVITTQDPFETGFVGWRIAKYTRSKFQLQIHTDFLSPYFIKESILNRIRVRIAKFLLPKADGIRVVSNRIKKTIKGLGLRLKNSPEVLPIFVYTDAIVNAHVDVDMSRQYSQFDVIILLVSRFECEKNISLAIDVFGKVIKKFPNVGLLIAGSGSELKNLKRKVKSIGIKENVIFLGMIGNVSALYKTADIFLHTSNYEGYGMSLVEAGVIGCPIVTTDVGIVSEFFEDGVSAEICPIGDEDCLAERLIRLVEKEDARRALARASKTAILEKIKEKTKEQYLTRYKKLWERCF